MEAVRKRGMVGGEEEWHGGGAGVNTGAKVRQSDCALKQKPDFFYSHAGSSRTFSFSLLHCSLFTEKPFPQKWSLCHLSLRSLSISGCEIRAKYIIYFIYYYFEPKMGAIFLNDLNDK